MMEAVPAVKIMYAEEISGSTMRLPLISEKGCPVQRAAGQRHGCGQKRLCG